MLTVSSTPSASRAAVRVYLTAQEILVDNSSYPIARIAENSHVFRTLGLGYANLGSLVMSYGLPYDSDEARSLTGAITAIMTGEAYAQSARMAQIKGPFKGYKDARCSGVEKTAAKDNVEPMQQVVAQHRQEVEKIQRYPKFEYLLATSRECWDEAIALGKKHGYRNAQVTVLAPTGTISFFMDSDTTGIEPDIALVKYKILAGGGNLKIVNQTVPEALTGLGYKGDEIRRIIDHVEAYDTIEDVALTADDAIVKIERAAKGGCGRQRPQAGAPARVRLRLQGSPRNAQPALHRAPQGDERGPALHFGRHFQDRQRP